MSHNIIINPDHPVISYFDPRPGTHHPQYASHGGGHFHLNGREYHPGPLPAPSWAYPLPPPPWIFGPPPPPWAFGPPTPPPGFVMPMISWEEYCEAYGGFGHPAINYLKAKRYLARNSGPSWGEIDNMGK